MMFKPPEDTDEQALWIRSLKEDAETALRQLFIYYDKRLMAYASKICVTTEDAEEVVQDVFIALWKNRKNIEGDDVAGWLIRVCRNLAIKSLRNHIINSDLAAVPEVPTTLMDPQQKLYYEEIDHCLQQIIRRLPAERQKIFLMSREENRSHRDIAKQLGLSEQTVKKQVSLALKDIRSQLTPHLEIMTLVFFSQY